MKARQFAVFDIDGTILRWQLYHAVADELVKRGHMDPAKFESVRQSRLGWKKRSNQGSYADYEASLVKFFELAIVDTSPSEFQSASRAVIETYKDQVYTYTRDLIAELKNRNFLLFAISASQHEIVQLLAEYYGFDDSEGSKYEIKQGAYTGKGEILISDKKPAFLKQLAAKHNATWQGSIGVGDSESDIPMLETIQNPIAFNPTKKLFDHAQARGWNIVVERKNMVYRLGSQGNKYELL